MFVPLSNPRNWPCPLTGPVGLGLEDETSAERAAHKNEGASLAGDLAAHQDDKSRPVAVGLLS